MRGYKDKAFESIRLDAIILEQDWELLDRAGRLAYIESIRLVLEELELLT